MRRLRALAAVLALLAAGAGRSAAHEGLHEQIARASRCIEESPGDVELLLRRGELYRLHREFAAAEADLERAAELAPGSEELLLARGRLFRDQGRWRAAEIELRRFLRIRASDGTARLLLAEVLAEQQDLEAAEVEYTRALVDVGSLWPEHFLALARVTRERGPEHRRRALAVLDDGVARLGPVPSLVLAAVELEVEGEDHDGALRRLDQLAQASPRKEQWFARRGEILRRAGREDEALQAFQAALDAIERLSPRARRTRSVLELEAQLRQCILSGTERREEEP